MNKFLSILVLYLICFSSNGKAQSRLASVEAGDTNTNVVIHADPRLAILLKKHKAVTTGIHSGRGYRVQIYSGSDRAAATRIKIDFMKRFPGVRSYMTYVSPHFRIKVGDYRSHGEAEKMYQQVSALYNPCMIVPDIVILNTLKDD